MISEKHEKLVTNLKNRWRANIMMPNLVSDFESIFDTFEGVLKLIDVAGPSALDMTGFNPDTTNGEQLIAALRASFRWKDEVPGWEDALATVRQVLEHSHVDVNSYLEGLV